MVTGIGEEGLRLGQDGGGKSMEREWLLRRTKETSQYGRSTSNYGTCKECLMRYMIIMHMSPYDTYGSM